MPTVADYPNLAKEWDHEKNEKKPEDYTAGSGKKIWWICSKKVVIGGKQLL